MAADAHVHVGAQRAFLHVAVAGAEIAHDAAQFSQICAGFFRAADVGLAHDLHQRDPGAVEVDERQRRMLVVHRFSCVMLQMQASDADRFRAAVGKLDRHRTGADDRVLVLADLVACRKIGVEIVLAIEAAHQIDVRGKPEPSAHRLCDAFAVDDRQHPRERGIDEAHLRIGRGAEPGRRPAEQFCRADHLGVDFETDHDLPRAALACDRVAHADRPTLSLSAPGAEWALSRSLMPGGIMPRSPSAARQTPPHARSRRRRRTRSPRRTACRAPASPAAGPARPAPPAPKCPGCRPCWRAR